MKFFKSSAAAAHKPSCSSHRTVRGWRSNRGYMFAMMLAMLALMAMMGVGLSRLMMTTKATTQMQRSQDTKQLLNSVVMTLSSKAADSDGDFVLEPPAMQSFNPATPTVGGLLPEDVANVDAWGRRLGYCAYDYGTQPTVAATGRIRGSTNSSPTDSWVAVVVISAGPDGVINTTTFCPAAGTAASDVAAEGDDMVAARSYGEMISFGNAQIASKLSGLGSNTTNKLCRLGSDGKMICDISTGLSGSNTANRLCRTNADGALVCDTAATSCLPTQVTQWNGSSFLCKDLPSSIDTAIVGAPSASCGITLGGGGHDPSVATCPSGYILTGGGYVMTYWSESNPGTNSPDSQFPSSATQWTVIGGGAPKSACFAAYAVCARIGTGVSLTTVPNISAPVLANCGGQGHGSTWTASCPSPQTGTISYSCNNGSTTETGRTCAAPPLSTNFTYVTPWGKTWWCLGGNCYRDGRVALTVTRDGTSSITLQAADPQNGGTITNTFLPGGNMCGRNSSGGGGVYATYQGVFYGDGVTPSVLEAASGGTAGVTSRSAVGSAKVNEVAAAAGCVIY
jgi:hypothetical protein